jgi:hypothetical protein
MGSDDLRSSQSVPTAEITSPPRGLSAKLRLVQHGRKLARLLEAFGGLDRESLRFLACP